MFKRVSGVPVSEDDDYCDQTKNDRVLRVALEREFDCHLFVTNHVLMSHPPATRSK